MYLCLHLGKLVHLSPEAEEVAGFYAALLESQHAQDAVFNKNFFEDWKTVMKQYPPVRVHLPLHQQRLTSSNSGTILK